MLPIYFIILSIIIILFVKHKNNKKIKFFVIAIFVILLSVFIGVLNYDSNIVKLGKGYFYDKTKKHVLCNYNKDIPPYVISYDYDRYHIIVEQRPQYKEYAIYGKVDYPKGKDNTYYWIIIKQSNEVIGPMLYDDFVIYRKENNISEKLSFE